MKRHVEPVYGHIGESIRAQRTRLGMSQAELARRTGRHRSTITHIESGRERVMLHDLPEIATALGLTIAQLLPPTWSKR